MSKEKYIAIQQEIESYGFTIVAKDFERPCGAFLVLKRNKRRILQTVFLMELM
jgi:hypothetical protein